MFALSLFRTAWISSMAKVKYSYYFIFIRSGKASVLLTLFFQNRLLERFAELDI